MVQEWQSTCSGVTKLRFRKEETTEIDERLVLLRDERKRFSAAFGTLITERQNAVSALKDARCLVGSPTVAVQVI